jgi:hypothetical protein
MVDRGHELDKEKSLFIICGYRRDRKRPDANRGASILERVTGWLTRQSDAHPFFQKMRDHDILQTDYWANSRELRYLCDMVKAGVAEQNRIRGIKDLLIDGSLGKAVPSDLGRIFDSVEFSSPMSPEAWERGSLSKLKGGEYVTAVLVYPDALGLGCAEVERRVANTPVTNIVVMNGRRRTFLLDGHTKRSLSLHRFLARNRIGEKVFALLIVSVAAVCAAVDFVSDRVNHDSASR